MSENTPKLMAKEVSCRNFPPMFYYLNEFHKDICVKDSIDELLRCSRYSAIDAKTGLPHLIDSAYLLNLDNWVSSELTQELFSTFSEKSGDPLFNFKAAREGFRLKTSGIKATALKLMSPIDIVKRIPAENAKLNRTKTVEIVKNEKEYSIVRLRLNNDLVRSGHMSRLFCEHNRGAYEGLGLLTGHMSHIEETCCTFDGADYCEFHIKWKNKSLWSRVGDLIKRWIARDLIDDLEDKEKKNIDLIRNQEEIIESRTRQLKDAQAQLIEVEKRTLEHRITGGFAHEMRNALAGAQLEFKTTLNYKDQGKPSAGILKDSATNLLKNISAIHQKYNIPRGEIATLFLPELKTIAEIADHLAGVHADVSHDLDRGLSITTQIRDYARMSELRPGNESVDMVPLLKSYGGRYRQDFERIGITYSVEGMEQAVVKADETHINSIFSNLVLNARDALEEIDDDRPKEIKVRVEVKEDETATFFVITVTDNGPGIPEDKLSEIFEPFYSTKPTSGTGLGLGIVKRLVQLYDGMIKVNSKVGEGTKFSVNLRA